MNVSNFELIYKAQAPVPPIGVPNVETVVQGYFLTITNLEDKALSYRVEFVTTPPPATAPQRALRTLADNTVVFVDSPGSDNAPGALTGSIDDTIFRLNRFVRIPPNGTALIAVLPSIFNLPGLDPTPITQPEFEVRGYVRLTLPALFQFGPGLFLRPQSDVPVKVLITPQHRSLFLTPEPANQITDQVVSPLPTASGAAENLLDPEQGIIFPMPLPAVGENLTKTLERLAANPDLPTAETLMFLLAQIDADNSDLRGFNKMLSDADIPMAIERRKRK